MKRIASGGDFHFPYHNPVALRMFMRVCAVIGVDEVVLNGDILDFYSISPFSRDPHRKEASSLKQERVHWLEFASDLRLVMGNKKVRVLWGNHDDRLRKERNRLLAFADLDELQLPNFLKLEDYDFEFAGHEYLEPEHKVLWTHGTTVGKNAGDSAKKELALEYYQVSTVTNHTHRLGQVNITHRFGTVFGIESGCLCDLHPEPEYVKNRTPNWQNAMVITYLYDHGRSHSAPVLFHDPENEQSIRAYVEGQEIRL